MLWYLIALQKSTTGCSEKVNESESIFQSSTCNNICNLQITSRKYFWWAYHCLKIYVSNFHVSVYGKIKYQYILGKKGYKETNVFQKYSYWEFGL